MKILNALVALALPLTLLLAACDGPGDDETSAGSAEGTATDGEVTGGSTEGGTADGSGDGPTSCEGPNPSGCIETGCGEGEVCSTETEECISSACSCDEASGQWQCTPDCSGGVCVPQLECEGPNPAGCIETGCDEGEVCSTETEECISSSCTCDEATGQWVCTDDCGGGSCIPEGMGACPGVNPADECPEDPEACVPSGCVCDPVAEAWSCTPDCNGGTRC
ncbi:hypothetical protein [Paraliomyxa miuraensis]|uniref:hypothetical protein n=1 Tax=Paraliomyxa miuraensis TaxID=376150 RepID=UPI0022551D65|nr:hypothetical protein [Paraliomyxa miuraensis]MCX4243615.1 hypothetical protein [Paraliomyxa miuraensis]